VAAAPEAVIEGFSPHTVPPEAALFAKRVVALSAPGGAKRAKALLFACSKLGAFAIRRGLELDAEVLLSDPVIERFVLTGMPAMTPATRRTVRANLRHVAARLPGRPPVPAIPRGRTKAPYSNEEIASYLALADAQPTASRRGRASALICLGAGCGLVGSELRSVRGHDVARAPGGLVVHVVGGRERTVPVLSCYHDRLVDAARARGDGLLLGGSVGDPNVLSRLTASLCSGSAVARIDTGRLRASWLVSVAGLIGLRAFLEAAGVSCTQRLGDLASYLPVPCEADAVALLGGGSS